MQGVMGSGIYRIAQLHLGLNKVWLVSAKLIYLPKENVYLNTKQELSYVTPYVRWCERAVSL